ncbi:MAG: hypothetical protein KJ737_11775 [Proteobacteria bacterium]|nr:hypothetical protein [Pseudomonadota bacterium]
MTFNRPQILKIVIAIVILFTILGSIKKAQKEWKDFNHNEKDIAVQYEEKLGPVKKLLPPGVNIGYTNDDKDSGKFAESLYLTQYALSPHKVMNNEMADFIIASFTNPAEKVQFIKDNHLSLVKDIDDKMALYTRKTQ